MRGAVIADGKLRVVAEFPIRNAVQWSPARFDKLLTLIEDYVAAVISKNPVDLLEH